VRPQEEFQDIRGQHYRDYLQDRGALVLPNQPHSVTCVRRYNRTVALRKTGFDAGGQRHPGGLSEGLEMGLRCFTVKPASQSAPTELPSPQGWGDPSC